jgi:hypothetical protein
MCTGHSLLFPDAWSMGRHEQGATSTVTASYHVLVELDSWRDDVGGRSRGGLRRHEPLAHLPQVVGLGRILPHLNGVFFFFFPQPLWKGRKSPGAVRTYVASKVERERLAIATFRVCPVSHANAFDASVQTESGHAYRRRRCFQRSILSLAERNAASLSH